nr:hypothetical protein BaRGS_015843 [Batillaria attramentaria]
MMVEMRMICHWFHINNGVASNTNSNSNAYKTAHDDGSTYTRTYTSTPDTNSDTEHDSSTTDKYILSSRFYTTRHIFNRNLYPASSNVFIFNVRSACSDLLLLLDLKHLSYVTGDVRSFHCRESNNICGDVDEDAKFDHVVIISARQHEWRSQHNAWRSDNYSNDDVHS